VEHATDEILCADCLDVLARLPAGIADLVYMDPPFNTGATRRTDSAAYPDAWPDIDAYLAYWRLRTEAAIRTLKPDGSILIHCDWRTSHRFRCLLDELLGPEAFVNHLIWSYGLGGSSPRRFARKHDDILFYAKSGAYFFQPPMIPATSQRMRGRLKKATDVIDVPSINNMASERTGYPTQKPVALLRLLIEACCPPVGLVLNPCCGSGTALVAAALTGRRFLGVDQNPEAVAIARARCREVEIGAGNPPVRTPRRAFDSSSPETGT